MKTRNLLLTLSFILLTLAVSAQDFFYTQYYHAPHRLNPALTGIFYGDLRATANVRTQWWDESAEYGTQSLQVDWKFYPNQRVKQGFWSMGAGLNHDRSGNGTLDWTDFNLSGSYAQPVGQKTLLSIGGQLGIANRRVDYDGLTFGNQFNEGRGIADPSIPIDDPLFQNREDLQSNYFADFSAGINFHFQTQDQFAVVDRLNKRTNFDIGIAFFHLNTPDQRFSDDNAPTAPLPLRYSPYLRGVIQVGKSIDVVGNATYQFQNIAGYSGGHYSQTSLVGAARIHIDKTLGQQIMLELGLGYRFSVDYEAYFPHLTFTYNNWQAGISYDVTNIDTNNLSNTPGTLELYARYILATVRPGRACLIL